MNDYLILATIREDELRLKLQKFLHSKHGEYQELGRIQTAILEDSEICCLRNWGHMLEYFEDTEIRQQNRKFFFAWVLFTIFLLSLAFIMNIA